jgi:uncharacterized cupin superfamily protein
MDWSPVPEAEMAVTDQGTRLPSGPGWFIVNVADAAAVESAEFGAAALFDGGFLGGHRFDDLGVNVRVLQPGQKATIYHREPHQEAFLVLSGEALLIVEDETRSLYQWDFFHSPPGTAHAIVGAGSGPCAVLMVGGRGGGAPIVYPTSAVAGGHGAAVAADTQDASVAYANVAPPRPTRLEWPPGAPE